MVKVSWNLSGKEDSGEDRGVMSGGVVVLSVIVTIAFLTEELVFEGVDKGDVLSP